MLNEGRSETIRPQTAGEATRAALDALERWNHDPEDPMSEDRPVGNVMAEIDRPIAGLRIGIQRRWFFDDLAPELDKAMEEAVATFRAEGAQIVDIDLGDVEKSHELLAFKVVLADAYNLHKDRLERMPEAFGRDVYTRAMLGKEVRGHEYAAALRWNESFKQRLRQVFGKVDAIVSPTLPFGAPPAEAGLQGEAWFATIRQITRYTSCWPFAGVPALSVPCGFDRAGMPLGMQIATPWFDEAMALRIGHAFQKVTDHHLRTPRTI